MKYSSLKGVLEPFIALLILPFALPAILLAAALVKADSPGPALFWQKRLGHKKRQFMMCKIRTMRQGAENELKDLKDLNITEPPAFKAKRDPRTTRAGRLLRATNLDELPQLINIIRGEMRFIGFRPPTPDEVRHYRPEHMIRFEGHPGITSLWAVSGMHKLPFDEWIRLDAGYEQNQSLTQDISIAARTAALIAKKLLKAFGSVF